MPSLFDGRNRPFRLFPMLGICLAATIVWSLDTAQARQPSGDPIRLTHGPMLGKPTANSMVVWGRTSEPGEFTVYYGTDPDRLEQVSEPGATAIERDNAGTVKLLSLQPDTRYYYQVWVNERPRTNISIMTGPTKFTFTS